MAHKLLRSIHAWDPDIARGTGVVIVSAVWDPYLIPITERILGTIEKYAKPLWSLHELGNQWCT